MGTWINGIKQGIASFIGIVGDVNSVAWANYADTSTIVGWTSYTAKTIYYKKVGNLVFVNFYIDGTSNSTAVTFTLPYTSKNDTMYYTNVFIRGKNNGSQLTTPGFAQLPPNSNIVTCYSTQASGGWAAGNTKYVVGQFCYEAA